MTSRSRSRHPSDVRPLDETYQVANTEMATEASRSSVPTSALLQGLLKEKKAESRRLSRNLEFHARHVSAHGETFDPTHIQSSPTGPSNVRVDKHRQNRRTSAMGTRNVSAAKEMGVREMEEVRCLQIPLLYTSMLTEALVYY